MQSQFVFVCPDGGFIASTQLEWLQGGFDTLTGLFYTVGIRKKYREDSWNDLFPMTHSRDSVGGGLRGQDDRDRPNIPVPSEVAGPVSRLCIEPGGRSTSGTM